MQLAACIPSAGLQHLAPPTHTHPPARPPRRSLASLQRWAAEVCAAGSFAAPYGDDRAALNLGGLPVPCLVVGNKLDCLPKYRGRYALTWGEQVCVCGWGVGWGAAVLQIGVGGAGGSSVAGEGVGAVRESRGFCEECEASTMCGAGKSKPPAPLCSSARAQPATPHPSLCPHAPTPPTPVQLWATLQRPLARLRDCLALALARRRGGASGDASMSRQASRSLSVGRSGSGGLGLPKEALLHGNLQASVARGDLDMHAGEAEAARPGSVALFVPTICGAALDAGGRLFLQVTGVAGPLAWGRLWQLAVGPLCHRWMWFT